MKIDISEKEEKSAEVKKVCDCPLICGSPVCGTCKHRYYAHGIGGCLYVKKGNGCMCQSFA